MDSRIVDDGFSLSSVYTNSLHQFGTALEILLPQQKTTCMKMSKGFVLSCRFVTVVVIVAAGVLQAHDE